jgi:hypothetical protein
VRSPAALPPDGAARRIAAREINALRAGTVPAPQQAEPTWRSTPGIAGLVSATLAAVTGSFLLFNSNKGVAE